MSSNKTFTINDKRFLVSRILNIKDMKCYKQLFKLLFKENIKYTRNSNGIFFNVGVLEDDILNKIDTILSFYEIEKEKTNINNIY